MRNIEEQLWNYLDGTCTPQEREVIEHLIATEKEYQQKYEELKAFNLELEQIELDAPPMAFTYNVMEAIRTEEASKPLKAAIDTRIIKVIAGFFIITLAAILGIAFISTDWSVGASGGLSMPEIKVPDIKNYVSGPVLKGFLFFDVVFVLYLLDSYLRKRKLQQQA